MPNPGAGTSSTGADNPKLYRVSTGHGGVFCEGCHGATHAEFDTDAPSLSNDDVAAMQLQGHTGTIVECSTCHGNAMNDEIPLDGPHGMHPVGANTRFADGGHEDLAEDDLQACQACHGPGTYKSPLAVGTVLSLAKTDRDFRGLARVAWWPRVNRSAALPATTARKKIIDPKVKHCGRDAVSSDGPVRWLAGPFLMVATCHLS